MPPAKKAIQNDDTRSDTSTVRDRQAAGTGNGRGGKKQGNKVAQQAGGSNLKEFTTVTSKPAPSGRGTDNPSRPVPQGMDWQSLPTAVLDRYRTAHHLHTPEAFTSPWRQSLLTKPGGIGRQSPTMARAKQDRRVGKDQLALAVRKHFNAAGVSESEVIVEFIYAMRHHDKSFKMRSHPLVSKKQ